MTKHTPGRLHLVTLEDAGLDGEPYWYLDCENGARTGMEFPKATTIVDPERGILTEADAHRLMECWNACVGICPKAVPDLVEALQAARDDLADTLEASVDAACPHDADGNIIRDKMDEPSRPMIEGMERLLAQIDAALAKAKEAK